MTLEEIRRNAMKAAKRDGYNQVIICANDDGSYSFSRKYPGACPEWYGKIVEEIEA